MVSKLKSASKIEPSNSWLRYMVAVLGVLVLGFAVWFLFAGNEIRLSAQGYEISKSLYAACNLQDVNRLEAVRRELEALELSPQERLRLADVLQLADEGKWSSAAERARALLQSQESL